MGWSGIVLLVFLLIVCTLLLSACIIYLQFGRSPVKQWRDRVFALAYRTRSELSKEMGRLKRLDGERQIEEAALREGALHRLLGSIAVDQLLPYPGIGPGTLDKLREAGFRTIAALRGVRLHVHGLGEKRQADIDAAVGDLIRKAQKQFEAGQCPEAREMMEKRRELLRQFEEREVGSKVRVKALQTVTSELQRFVGHARQVTFIRYFRPITETPLVPLEIQLAILPDLDRRLAEADAMALAALKSAGRTKRQSAAPESLANGVPVAEPYTAPTLPMPPVVPAAAGTAIKEQETSPRRPHKTADKKAASRLQRNPARVAEATDASLPVVIMETTIQFALTIARCAGAVQQPARQIIHEYFRQRYKHDQALANRAVALLAHYETSAIDWGHCLATIERLFAPEEQKALLEFAEQILKSCSGDLAPGIHFLQQLAGRWHADWQPEQPRTALPNAERVAQVVDGIFSPPATRHPPRVVEPAQPVDYRAVLEIEPDCLLSVDLIRRQYRLLHKRFDPQNQKSFGPEFVAVAQKKQAEVVGAAEALLKPFDAPLAVDEPPAETDLRPNRDLEELFRN